MAGEHGKPLDLRGRDAVDLGSATDFHILLRAIDETMPDDATLYLEGAATAPVIARFLCAHQAAEPGELAADPAGGTVAHHLPLADENLARLRLLAEDCVASEVALHVVVYRGEEVLLWARDAGCGSLLLARSLPEDTMERVRLALGATLKPHRRHSLFALLRPRHQ
jgi:hypothetical protein